MEYDAAKELVDLFGLENVHEEHCADMAKVHNDNKLPDQDGIDGGNIWEEICNMRQEAINDKYYKCHDCGTYIEPPRSKCDSCLG